MLVTSTGVISACEKQGRMKPRILPSERTEWQSLGACWALSLTITFLALGAPTPSQEPPQPAQSIADAARKARAQNLNFTAPPRVFTNDDLSVAPSPPSEMPISKESSPKRAEAPTSEAAGCSAPDDDRLKAELQAAQDELDKIRRELSYDPPVVSGGNVDLTNFKPGSSGLAFGSPPLLQTQPQSPARVDEVILEERVESLKQASSIACDSPKDAKIQEKLDSAEKQLNWLQREFDLDRDAYYSKPNYAEDTAGKAKLDDEQQQIQSLQSEIDSLKDKLVTPKAESKIESIPRLGGLHHRYAVAA